MAQSQLHWIELQYDLLPPRSTAQIIHHAPKDCRGFLVTELAINLDDLMIRFLELLGS